MTYQHRMHYFSLESLTNNTVFVRELLSLWLSWKLVSQKHFLKQFQSIFFPGTKILACSHYAVENILKTVIIDLKAKAGFTKV